MEPCFACDFGSYQPSYGQTQCPPCPLNTTTERRGSTDVSDCLPIYYGETDDCRTERPCLNGGRCLQDESGYVCECRDYYVGKTLTYAINTMTNCTNTTIIFNRETLTLEHFRSHVELSWSFSLDFFFYFSIFPH